MAAGLADAKHISLSASLELVVVFTLQEEQTNGAQAFLRGQNVFFFRIQLVTRKKKKGCANIPLGHHAPHLKSTALRE